MPPLRARARRARRRVFALVGAVALGHRAAGHLAVDRARDGRRMDPSGAGDGRRPVQRAGFSIRRRSSRSRLRSGTWHIRRRLERRHGHLCRRRGWFAARRRRTWQRDSNFVLLSPPSRRAGGPTGQARSGSSAPRAAVVTATAPVSCTSAFGSVSDTSTRCSCSVRPDLTEMVRLVPAGERRSADRATTSDETQGIRDGLPDERDQPDVHPCSGVVGQVADLVGLGGVAEGVCEHVPRFAASSSRVRPRHRRASGSNDHEGLARAGAKTPRHPATHRACAGRCGQCLCRARRGDVLSPRCCISPRSSSSARRPSTC